MIPTIGLAAQGGSLQGTGTKVAGERNHLASHRTAKNYAFSNSYLIVFLPQSLNDFTVVNFVTAAGVEHAFQLVLKGCQLPEAIVNSG